MPKEIIRGPELPPPAGPYSPGVRAGGLIFVSGQIASDVRAPVEAQARQALEGLGRVLAAAGAGFGDVVKVTIYLTDMWAFAKVNEVYASFFPSAPPARACVAVAALPQGAAVEVEAVAAAPGAGP